jgi:hypothetical protein
MARKTLRKTTTRSILTRAQRRQYADMLKLGVPQQVIKEFDESLTKYLRDWKRAVRRAVLANRAAKTARKAR